MDKIGERLSYLIDSKGLNKSKFSKEYGFTDSAIRAMCSGDKPIGMKIIKRLVEVFPNLNLNWFLFGEGSINHIQYDINNPELILNEPEENSKVDLLENVFLTYLDKKTVRKKLLEIVNDEKK